jgi:acetyl-CoA/propionyl-CoA carboxylase biotin carboxyl carrier protein
VGTRDCSLQRRNQKLVEEAPAPFLTDEQRERIHSSAKAICREANYHGAGTVEYLVGADGVISFLEVNTRLQVEHPVSEETTGLDLVREQFRIADGEPLRITEDPTPRGHAIEFRINGEDAGRNFLPAPGRVTDYREPAGPGVRVDSGIEAGSTVGGAWPPCCRSTGQWSATRPSHRPTVLRSACSPGGSKPSSTTRSRRSPARPSPRNPLSGNGWWSR